jgi:hypothetical protein
MKYDDLINKVDKIEEETELTECIYFGAIDKLEDVQKDLTKLDDVKHLRRVIKPFLIQWGMMGRVVGREGLDWVKLGLTLRSLETEFKELTDKRLSTIDFGNAKISTAIKSIYEKLDPIAYIGSPTTVSKILHLLIPEVFVMWDNEIKKVYKKKNSRIRETPEGYLEFLKETQRELIEALDDRSKEVSKELDEIEQEIRYKYKNKTLAKIVDEYNWITAHPVLWGFQI